MTLQELRDMKDSGTFHHATYRNLGTLWEGLWIYSSDLRGFGGYTVAGCFAKDSAELEAAEDLVRGTGISIGAYGRG
jgi:hypothetical protein